MFNIFNFCYFSSYFLVMADAINDRLGFRKEASRVATHLLILSVFSDFPIFVTVISLANKSYKKKIKKKIGVMCQK